MLRGMSPSLKSHNVIHIQIALEETPVGPADSEEYFLRTKLEMITYAIDIIFGIPRQ